MSLAGGSIGGAGQTHHILLQDILPWIAQKAGSAMTPNSRTAVLVQDTLETSGRFLFYLTAAQAAASGSRILWLTCTASQNSRVIRQGLSQMTGISAAMTGSSKNITIRNILQEMRNQNDDINEKEFDAKTLVQTIYYSVVDWWGQQQQQKEQEEEATNRDALSSSSSTAVAWIFLADISSLSNLVGKKLAYALAFQLRVFQQQQNKNQDCRFAVSLMISCAGDGEVMNSRVEEEEEEEAPHWVGAGGRWSPPRRTNNDHWECSLIELADWVVDVLPLTTGISRGVHGRLILTPITTNDSWIANYCLGENQIWATRVLASKHF